MAAGVSLRPLWGLLLACQWMEPQQALPQFTSYALRETSRFLRHLANACDRLEQTGSLPPTLFAAQVPQQGPRPPPPAAGYGVGPDSAQPIFSQPAASPGSMPSPPRPQKRRKAEKRTRAPTGYNVFVQQKLESLKQQGLYSQFSDSKVRAWRHVATADVSVPTLVPCRRAAACRASQTCRTRNKHQQ